MIRSFAIVIGLALGLWVLGAPFWVATVVGMVAMGLDDFAQAWRQDHGLHR